MKLAAVIAAAVVGVALSVWGVVQLVPGEMSAVAAARAPAPGPRVVRSLQFEGDLDPAAVHAELRTRVGGPLRAADLAADRALLQSTLVAESHLDAHVAPPSLGPSGTDVVFTIDAGPPFRVRSVRLAGRLARRFPQLAEQLTIAAGDDVSARAIGATQDRIAAWLGAHGVGRVVVRHRVDVDHAAAQIDLTYDVEPALAVADR